ncbi:unnamed protein product [Macrosiphum euphorbiae]|uniref:Chromo shadow domain-containing protein n=1 Tax=Macrosiphum euphorbiae TaxID=13131 RepID=A0AAV0XYN5_9HEMI|nr:unnamed protein product [Macrosiphum euphorbiae]
MPGLNCELPREGEDDESEASGFWTPPSTIGEDVEEVQVPRNTARRATRRPNTARRSRASRPGVFAVRRGRHRQPIAEQEFIELTPFERGLTFNGFARDLVPERIVGHQLEGYRKNLYYRVKWRTVEEPKLIEASVMKAYRRDLIVDYFEKRVKEDF